MYEKKDLSSIIRELVRKGLDFDEVLQVCRTEHGILLRERGKALDMVELYFNALNEYEAEIGEMESTLRERIDDLTSYIDYIRRKGGANFPDGVIENILEDNGLMIFDKVPGA